MSRGLGVIQKRVIAALEYIKRKNDPYLVFRALDVELAKKEPSAEIKTSEINYHKFVDVFFSQKDGWNGVLDVVYMAVQGNHCFETNETHDLPTLTQKQSVWRAIRALQKRGLVTTQRCLTDVRFRRGYGGGRVERIIKLY